MKTLDALQSIGFSEYEAKTYLALLTSSPATGYQISKTSGVPRSMVYEVLNRLQTRGIVLKSDDEKNAVYRPLDPDALLKHHKSHLNNTLDYLQPQLEKIYSEEKDNRIWTLNDLETIITYASAMLSQASDEVFLMANDTHLTLLKPTLADLASRELDAHFLLTGSEYLDFGDVARHPPLESERQGLLDTLLVLVDNHEVLIAGTVGTPNATITTNPNLVLIARQFIWMEFFTQRILAQIGEEMASSLGESDREILINKLQLKDWSAPK